jgi:hypothetical protein
MGTDQLSPKRGSTRRGDEHFMLSSIECWNLVLVSHLDAAKVMGGTHDPAVPFAPMA